MGGAQVGGEHDSGHRVEREPRRRAPPGRRRAGDGGHEAELHERVDPRGTVDRASPVACAREARVRGTPSRRSWNSSLAPDVPSADPRLMSTIH